MSPRLNMTANESHARGDGANTDRCPKQHIFVTQIDRPSSTNHLNPARRQTFPDVSAFKKRQVAHTTTLIMMITWPTFAPTMDGKIRSSLNPPHHRKLLAQPRAEILKNDTRTIGMLVRPRLLRPLEGGLPGGEFQKTSKFDESRDPSMGS